MREGRSVRGRGLRSPGEASSASAIPRGLGQGKEEGPLLSSSFPTDSLPSQGLQLRCGELLSTLLRIFPGGQEPQNTKAGNYCEKKKIGILGWARNENSCLRIPKSCPQVPLAISGIVSKRVLLVQGPHCS